MLTSASQRFNWKTTALRLTNNGLNSLEETPRHVTCCKGKSFHANKLTLFFVFFGLEFAFVAVMYVMFKVLLALSI